MTAAPFRALPRVSAGYTLVDHTRTEFGEPLVGDVTAIDGSRVSISLGSRRGVQVMDWFEVAHELVLPDGVTTTEVRAIIGVLYALGPDRVARRATESLHPMQVRGAVRPAAEWAGAGSQRLRRPS